MKHKGYNNALTGRDHKFDYNGKEVDEDLGLNWHHYGFRMYDAAIGRFPSIDPISDQFPHVSTYNYAENEPVGSIDLHGLQRVKVNGKIIKEELSGSKRTIQERMQVIRNTKRALRVGDGGFGSTNITGVVGRTARHASGVENSNFSEEERNAFRHALFSATLQAEFGFRGAIDVANAHEGISPNDNVELIYDQPFEGDESGADQTADIFNNVIGREIGARNEGADNKILAIASLVQFHFIGLNVARKDKNGKFVVETKKITREQFNTALDKILSLDENGFDKKDHDDMRKKEEESN